MAKTNREVIDRIMSGQIVINEQRVDYVLTVVDIDGEIVGLKAGWCLAGEDVFVEAEPELIWVSGVGSQIRIAPTPDDFPRPFMLSDVVRID